MKHVSRLQPKVTAKRAMVRRNGKGKGRRWKRRKWTKRARAGLPAVVVTKEMIGALKRAYRRWLWQAFRACDRSLEDVAAEIGGTRQGFSNLLRFDERLFFDTFLRTLFVRRGCETGIEIVAEGWKIQLRWTVTRCNCGCVSSRNGRA